jgi:hypothetical protein
MDKSKRPLLDEFGEAVMTHVRDEALSFLQRVISGKMADANSKELYAHFQRLDPAEAEFVGRLLVSAVDAGVVRFLHFIDEFELEILFRCRSGEIVNIREVSDGLATEFHTKDGWIAKFSRFQDRIRAAK